MLNLTPSTPSFRRAIHWFTLVCFTLQPLLAQAQVTADAAAAANKRPTIDTAANGVPIVQIATPNASGVSHNQYTDYNVSAAGLILNNSAVVVNTQLSGFIAGNANITGQAARLILNEVTSTNPSLLAGPTEIAGTRAELIIANPNGITCNGCGFINTSRLTLTTGAPVFGGLGSLDAFRVQRGTVTIGGAGLDASALDQVDLLARAVQINAGLWAQNLNVIVGANQIDYAAVGATPGVQIIAGAGNAPTVALDVAALGGMYAGKIRLIGTETGLGVSNAGQINATTSLALDSAGRVVFTSGSTIEAGTTLDIVARAGLSNAGDTHGQDVSLNVTGDLTNTGTLRADNTLSATASGALSNTGQITAGNDPVAGAHATLTLTAASLDNTGGQITNAGDGLSQITVTGAFTNSGTLGGNGNLSIAANRLTNTGTISAQNTLSALIADALDNSNGRLQAGDALNLTAGGDFTNTNGQVVAQNAHATLTLTAASLDNAGQIANAGDGATQITVTGALTNSGTLSGQGDVGIAANRLTNAGTLAAQGTLTALIADTLANQANAFIYAGVDALLYANTLTNAADGWIYAVRDLTIQKDNTGLANAQITNDRGTLQAGRDATIRTSSFTNTGNNPTVESRTLSDGVAHLLTACPGPSLNSGCSSTGSTDQYGSPIYLSAWGFQVATVGEVAAYFARNPDAPTSNPTLSRIFAPDFLSFLTTYRQDSHEREQGWVLAMSGSEQALASGQSIKSAQTLAGRDLIIEATTLTNKNALIDAGRNATLSGDTLINQGQTLQRIATYTSRHTTDGYFDSQTVVTDLGVVPASITSGNPASIHFTTEIRNDAQAIPATIAPGAANARAINATQVDLASLLNLPSGSNGASRPAAPNANYLVETNPAFTNRNNFISSDYFLNLLGLNPQNVQKRYGDGVVEQNLVRNQLFTLTGQRTLLTDASDLDQYQALMDNAVAANTAFHFTFGVALTESQIAALTDDIVWLVAQTVGGQSVLVPQVYLARLKQDGLSPDGALIAAKGIDLQTAQLTNSGTIKSTQNLDIAASNLTNSGTLKATGATNIATTQDLTNAGGLIQGDSVALNVGGTLSNRADRIEQTYALGQGSVTETETGAQGRIQATNNATLTADTIQFQGGQLSTGGNATLTANTIDLGTAQKQATFTDSGLTATITEHTGSTIQVGGTLTATATQDLNITGSSVNAQTINATAGGNLVIAAAEDKRTLSIDRKQNGNVDKVFEDIGTLTGSTLAATGNVSLTATNDLAIVGSRVSAGQDATLSAANIAIAAATTAQQVQREHQSKDGRQQGQFADARQIALGSVVQATNDLNIVAGDLNALPATSAGQITIQGSALAAGQNLALAAQSDVNFLATQTGQQTSVHNVATTSTTAETLSFELERNRVLLSTLTAGNQLSLDVGGNLNAETGTKDANGNLQADKMTVNGVVSGQDRQQVNVSGSGADQSKVLGDLNSQGIRNNANDSLSEQAIQSGQTAINALIESGLLSAGGTANLQAVAGGNPLTTTDASGKVQLTVAGQAQVQALYSQLRLTETFDVKHFPDAATAQLTTLVAAIALSTMTGGAGAALLSSLQGAALSATTAAMANAAFIGMTSTMLGQLAGGASLGDAFQAGLKAGASSAMTAGILNAQVFNGQSINQYAGVQNVAGTATSQASVTLANLNPLGLAARGIVNASVAQIVYGKEAGGFGSAVGQSIVSDLAAVGASDIGAQWSAGSVQNIIAHAALGAAAAKLTGKDATAGALGGATSAIVAPIIDGAVSGSGLADNTQRAIIATGSVLAGAAVAGNVTGTSAGALTGAGAAANEVLNNFLSHNEAQKRAVAERQKIACATDTCRQSAQVEIDRLNKLDQARDEAQRSACASPASPACTAWNSALQVAKQSYLGFDPASDPTGSVTREMGQVNQQAFASQQQVNNPYLVGVGKGLLKLSPPSLVAGVGVGAYALTTAIVDNGLTDTAIKIAQGLADLPPNIAMRLNSSDPTVRGEALVDTLALTGASVAVTAKLIAVSDRSFALALEKATVMPEPKLSFGSAATALDGVNGAGKLASVEVDIAKASKGTPEYNILNEPPPNSQVKLSNGTEFKTNSNGYVDEITYSPSLSQGVRDARQTAVGKEGLPTDVGGHVQGCQFGGTCDRFNLFPQDSNFNNSAYKRFENEIKGALNNGDQVGSVTVRFNRTDPALARPDSLVIDYSINGTKMRKSFRNEAGQ